MSVPANAKLTCGRLGLGKEPIRVSDVRPYNVGCILLQWKKLVSANVDLVTGLEGGRDNALLGFDGEVHLVDGTQDLVDLADRRLFHRQIFSEMTLSSEPTLFSR